MKREDFAPYESQMPFIPNPFGLDSVGSIALSPSLMDSGLTMDYTIGKESGGRTFGRNVVNAIGFAGTAPFFAAQRGARRLFSDEVSGEIGGYAKNAMLDRVEPGSNGAIVDRVVSEENGNTADFNADPDAIGESKADEKPWTLVPCVRTALPLVMADAEEEIDRAMEAVAGLTAPEPPAEMEAKENDSYTVADAGGEWVYVKTPAGVTATITVEGIYGNFYQIEEDSGFISLPVENGGTVGVTLSGTGEVLFGASPFKPE